MNTSGSIAQRLMSGGVLVVIGKMVAAASALLLNVLLTRMLDPDEVGVYYLLVSVVTVGALAAQLGVHQGIVRVLAGGLVGHESDVSRKAIRSAFIIVAFGSLLISLPYGLGGGQWLGEALFGSSLAKEMAVLVAIWIAICALQKLLSQIFRGLHYIGYATFYEGTFSALLLVATLCIFWLSGWEVELGDIIQITLCVLLVSSLLALLTLSRSTVKLEVASGVEIKSLLKISLPLFIASITVLGATEAHIWILGAVKSEDEVAIYGAAYRLAKLVVLPLIIINSVIPPMIAQFVAQGKMKEVERVLRVTATVSGIPSIFVVVLISFGAADILTLLFGDFYSQGEAVLIIVMGAQAMNALTGSPGVLLMMSNYQSVVMKTALLSGVLGLITSLLLVESLGGEGVAYGVAVGLSSHNIVMWAYCRYRLQINTHMGASGISDVMSVVKNIKKK